MNANDGIVYKSKYSKVCDIVGHSLPKTQQEENYCYYCEWEFPQTTKSVIKRMLKDFIYKQDGVFKISTPWHDIVFFKK